MPARAAKPRKAPAPKQRLLNKRELCREAGISRPTLDERIAADPFFPVVKRGSGNGESWQFDADETLAYLASGGPRPAAKEELSPNQQYMALRVAREQRRLAEEAGALVVASQMSSALSRALLVLSRELRAMPAAIGEEAGLSTGQQRKLRTAIENRLRSFVEGLKYTGLPDADG